MKPVKSYSDKSGLNYKKSRQISAWIVIAIIAATLFSAGCISGDGSGPVNAGILLPLSGEYETEGNSIFNGIQEATNESDGIKYTIRDTEGEPGKALEYLKEMNSLGIDIVIGPFTDEEIKTVYGYAAENDMILLLPFEEATGLTDDTGTVYRFSPDYKGEALIIAGLICDLLPEKEVVLVLYDSSDISLELSEHLGKYAYLDAEFIEYDQDVRERKIKKSGFADIVVWTGSPSEGANATGAINNYDDDAVIVLAGSLTPDEFYACTGEYSNLIYGICHPSPAGDEAMHGRYGYDTAMFLKEAVADGADSSKEFRNELNQNVYQGLSGIKYFKNENTVPPYFIIMKTENGEFVRDDIFTAKSMARVAAVYGSVTGVKSLLNDGHGLLPVSHGIYD